MRRTRDARNCGAGMATTGRTDERDETLLALIARRDRAALAALYDRYGQLAFQLAYGILRDRAAAEEVVLEAYRDLWRGASHCAVGRGSVRTRLFALVRRRALARARGQTDQGQCDDECGSPGCLATAEDPWRARPVATQRDALRQELAALPPVSRRVVELAYFAGCSETEIARIAGVSVAVVRQQLRRGLQRLGEGLTGAGVEA
jgi:RNA polymerase sigma-70 factor, ECF subfamily